MIHTYSPENEFQDRLCRYASYKTLEMVSSGTREGFSDDAWQQITDSKERYSVLVEPSLHYLDSLSDDELKEGFELIGHNNQFFSMIFEHRPELKYRRIEAIGFPIRQLAEWWLDDYERYKSEHAEGDVTEARRARRRVAAAHTELMSVHSSMPVYDIGETIARGMFQVMPGDSFPTAIILGGTQGRLELMPFWDEKEKRPISQQRINLIQRTDEAEFLRFREQAIEIATSYNEEMATFFYAMDAYWLDHAKSADDYVELRIEDLMHYTGKKPVKSGGRYSNAFRPDQIQRAGQMVYGLGFTMVEIEKTVIRGKGTRTHYKRLWEVEDMYSLQTLDGESRLDSIRYRPCDIFRNATFGSRRETALLMSRVLALDFDKMVVARRLGRYYTWLWRDRAHRGGLDTPISCETLLTRAGIEIKKGRERDARKALELALDRLEQEGIIAQWLLVDAGGFPVNTGERIPFMDWIDLRVAVTPPDSIVSHYTSKFISSAPSATIGMAPLADDDIERLKAAIALSGKSLREAAKEIGLDTSTLSRIVNGKTRNPQAKAKQAIVRWLEGR